MNQYKTYLFISLTAGLLALVAARPWSWLNYAVGIETAADSLRADSLSHAELDSLFIDPGLAGSVAITLPNVISDSLTYSVEARQKKKVYLEEQSAILQKQNQHLETRLKKQRQSLQEKQQSLLSMEQIEQALAKQNGKAQTASHLAVSGVETEVNQRSGGRKSYP